MKELIRYSTLHKRSFTMQGFFSAAVLLMAFAAGSRGFIWAGARRSGVPENPNTANEEECVKALMGCFEPPFERYKNKNADEAFEEIRNTPIRTHCSDWNTAVGCFRRVIYTDACGDVRGTVKELDKGLKIYDWFSNYTCVVHVDKVDRIFRCVVSLELSSEIASSCADEIENSNDPCVINANRDKIAQCGYRVITEKCGEEATSVVRDLTRKIYEVLDIGLEDKCETSICKQYLPEYVRSRMKELIRYSTLHKRSFTMQGFFSVAVLLVAFAAGVQSTPLAQRSNSEECANALMRCFAPAAERYKGKDMTEAFEEVRNTPIRTHCSDWNTAIGCFRQVIYTDDCDDVREDIKELEKNLEIYDWFSNYICVEHVDKIDRSFRCVVSLELFYEFASSCADEIENSNDPCVIIANRDKISQCSDGVVTGKCGAEAASVLRGINEKMFELMDINTADRCETSNRARQLAVLKNILRRL